MENLCLWALWSPFREGPRCTTAYYSLICTISFSWTGTAWGSLGLSSADSGHFFLVFFFPRPEVVVCFFWTFGPFWPSEFTENHVNNRWKSASFTFIFFFLNCIAFSSLWMVIISHGVCSQGRSLSSSPLQCAEESCVVYICMVYCRNHAVVNSTGGLQCND